MEKVNVIIMIQVSKCRWRIETKSGILLTDDIMIGLPAEAEDYVRKYITSYLNWGYELKLLEEK